jgi:transcriptional regulator with XRE-family HTH domain
LYKKYVQLRDSLGVTDYRVASDTGIPKSTFSDWKSGRSEPKVDKLQKLANYFGVSIEYFLEGDKGEVSRNKTD